MNYPTIPSTLARRSLPAMTPVVKIKSVAGTQFIPDPPLPCRMTAAAEFLTSTLIPAIGGTIMAATSPTDLGVIVGACFAGGGVAGALGMLISEAIPDYKIEKLTGLKRLAANWLAGLCAIPFVSAVRRAHFPDEDLGIVAAGLSAVFALFGVLVLAILIPMLVKAGRSRAQMKLGIPDEEPRMVIPSRPRETDTGNADTKRLV